METKSNRCRPPYSRFTRKIEVVDDESFALLKDLETFEATRLWNHDLILCAADGQTSFTEEELESLLDELEGAVDDSCLVLDELKKRGFEFDSVDDAIKVYDAESRRRKIEARNAARMELSVRGYDIKSNYDLKKAYAAEFGKYFGIDAAEVEKALVELGTGFEILGGKAKAAKIATHLEGEQI